MESHLVVLLLILTSKTFCENCDQYGVLFYEDIACKAIKIHETQCPSEYSCNFSQPKSGCFFRGKTYGAKEEIASDLTYSACSVGCRCDEDNSIQCAELECPEYTDHDTEPGCYNAHELGNCCSTEQICNSTDTNQCEVDGISYEIGQQFYPKDTCFTCVCHDDFTGEYDAQTCMRQNCASQILYAAEIAQKCAPAYFTYHSDEVLCCPDTFVCPDSEDTIKVVNQEADQNSTLECSYGEQKLKIGEGLRRNVYKHDKHRDFQCECILPPLLTCKEL